MNSRGGFAVVRPGHRDQANHCYFISFKSNLNPLRVPEEVSRRLRGGQAGPPGPGKSLLFHVFQKQSEALRRPR